MIETAITEGVKVSVRTTYEDSFSDPKSGNYYFSYKIHIENQSDHAIKLLRRKWMIFDSIGEHILVEGEGVVGEKPVIEPNSSYTYESACKLRSEIGKMWGVYYIERDTQKKNCCIRIPEFNLMVPYLSN